nr:viral capsid protein 91 [Neodiprion sertifer nucleopolyhedrovirus]
MFSIIALLVFIIVILYIYNVMYSVETDTTKHRYIYNLYLQANVSDLDSSLIDSISYISTVRWPIYEITTFDIDTLQSTSKMWYSSYEKTFNFYDQTFSDVQLIDEKITTNNANSFSIHVDDGWVNVDCPTNMTFDGNNCVYPSLCKGESEGTILPITETMIDQAVFRKLNRTATTTEEYHPTLYVVCNGDDTYEIKECEDNTLFDATLLQCIEKDSCDGLTDNFILSDRPDTLADNQYLMCYNNQTTIQTCEENQTFDTATLSCVDLDPCSVYGAGYTFITDELPDNQYYHCTSSFDKELITCPIRQFVDNVYSCTGDSRCIALNDGTGTILSYSSNTHFSYPTEALICDNYESSDSVICESVESELVIDPFTIDVKIPSVIFDKSTISCQDFDVTNEDVTVLNTYAALVNQENDYNVEYVTAVRVNIEKLLSDGLPVTLSQFFDSLEYARSSGSIGVSPLTGVEIDCYENILYDIFSGDRYNDCENNVLVSTNTLGDSEFYSTFTKSTNTTITENPCRLKTDLVLEDNIYVQQSTDSSVVCLYAMPLQEIITATTTETPGTLIETTCEENNIDLNNVVDSVVIISDELACRSMYVEQYNLIVTASFVPKMKYDDRTWNADTQSFDGVMYDGVLHNVDGKWISCPPTLFDETTAICDTAENTIYTVKDLHFEQDYPTVDLTDYENEDDGAANDDVDEDADVVLDDDDVDVNEDDVVDDNADDFDIDTAPEAINPILVRDNVADSINTDFRANDIATNAQSNTDFLHSMEFDNNNLSNDRLDFDKNNVHTQQPTVQDLIEYIREAESNEDEEYMDEADYLASFFE